MLWVCEECTTRYAVGLAACPQCGGTEWHEQGPADDNQEEPSMAKISRHGGPSDIYDPSLPPVMTEDGEDITPDRPAGVSWTEGVDSQFGVDAERVQAETGKSVVGVDGDPNNDNEDDGVGVDEDAADEFDPSAHSAADVVQYLDATDDPAERDRVIAAERAGKNRSSVVNR